MSRSGIDFESKKLLLKTIAELSTDQIEDFFGSLFSSAEIKDFSRRLMAAKLLHEKLTYEEVQDIMGMGSNTVNKIYFKTKGSPVMQRLFKKD